MLATRGFFPALAAVVCAGACPPAQGQTELLPLPGGTAPAPVALPGLPFKPQGYTLGIVRAPAAGQGEEAPAALVEEALRSIAALAPNLASSGFLDVPAPGCTPEDDACFAALGAEQKLDLVLTGSLGPAEGGLGLQLRLLDVAGRATVSQARQVLASTDRAELEASTESLGCALLVPAGCRGSARVDLDLPELQLFVDGAPQPRADEGQTQVNLELPVGAHRVRVAAGQRTSPERTLFVVRRSDPGVALYARQLEPGGLSLLSRADLPLALDGAVAVPRSQVPAPPSPHARWKRPAAYAAAGLGVLALGISGYEWQRGRSLAGDAASAYDRNGGFYRPADVNTVGSSRSATSLSKATGLAGLGLLAASAVLVFAF